MLSFRASAGDSGSRPRSDRSASTWATGSGRSATTTGFRSISRLARPSDPRRRPARELGRPALAAAAALVVLLHASLAPTGPVDAVLAQVGSRTISASDVALARALGVLGFAPSATPIEHSDV